eukprot:m.285593 g.285593  ORF g.285593 m.285593 type:complete len:285 (+) comp54977_c0_seq1:186-1040(+)
MWDVPSRRALCSHLVFSNQQLLASIEHSNSSLIVQGRHGHARLLDIGGAAPATIAEMHVGSVSFCRAQRIQHHTAALYAFPSFDAQNVDVYDVGSGEIAQRLHVVDGGERVTGMCMCICPFNPDSSAESFLAVGYEDGSVGIWSLTAAKMLSRQQLCPDPIITLEVNKHPTTHVIAGSSTNELYLMKLSDFGTSSTPKHVPLMRSGTNSLALRGDSKLLVAGGWDGGIRCFSWPKMKSLGLITQHKESINWLSFSHRLEVEGGAFFLAAACKDHTVSLWSLYND